MYINLMYMSKKKKKGVPSTSQTMAEHIRRNEELKEYGKLLSLRPTRVHESNKTYNRKKVKDQDRKELPDSFSSIDRLNYELENMSPDWTRGYVL